MSVSVDVELRCDSPSGTDRYACDEGPIWGDSAAVARRKAKRLGWKVSLPGGKDKCPDCAAALAPAAADAGQV